MGPASINVQRPIAQPVTGTRTRICLPAPPPKAPVRLFLDERARPVMGFYATITMMVAIRRAAVNQALIGRGASVATDFRWSSAEDFRRGAGIVRDSPTDCWLCAATLHSPGQSQHHSRLEDVIAGREASQRIRIAIRLYGCSSRATPVPRGRTHHRAFAARRSSLSQRGTTPQISSFNCWRAPPRISPSVPRMHRLSASLVRRACSRLMPQPM